jgi:Mn-containing catalase
MELGTVDSVWKARLRSSAMFMHNKRLQYTVRVSEPNPRLATMMMEQFGGADGELAAAMRYFTQALGEDDAGRKDMLLDIATEELSHLEVIGSIVSMLNKGAKAQLAEGQMKEAELYQMIGASGTTVKESILFGGGPALCDSAGVPWTAAYIDTRGEPTVDLRSNIAAEARAKIVYERLINITDDPGIKEALGFLMTREVAHQKSFEKALYAIENNFPSGKLPGIEKYASMYVNTSQGEGDATGPWNSGEGWDRVDDLEQVMPVDGGDGTATVKLGVKDRRVATNMADRTTSDPLSDPTTGADLGAGPGAGRTKRSDMGGAPDIEVAPALAKAAVGKRRVTRPR